MKINPTTPDYKGCRFPPAIISHAVWLYFRFALSFRDVEELLVQRGIVVTYETVRQWCLTFGQTYANELRRHRPRCGDKWHAGRASFSPSMARGTICGEPSIRTATCWISSSRADGTHTRRNAFSQAPRKTPICPARDHHGQAQALLASQTRNPAWRPAPPPQRPEQP